MVCSTKSSKFPLILKHVFKPGFFVVYRLSPVSLILEHVWKSFHCLLHHVHGSLLLASLYLASLYLACFLALRPRRVFNWGWRKYGWWKITQLELFPRGLVDMPKINLPKQRHGVVIFWTYRDLSSQADSARENDLKLSIFQLKQ